MQWSPEQESLLQMMGGGAPAPQMGMGQGAWGGFGSYQPAPTMMPGMGGGPTGPPQSLPPPVQSGRGPPETLPSPNPAPAHPEGRKGEPTYWQYYRGLQHNAFPREQLDLLHRQGSDNWRRAWKDFNGGEGGPGRPKPTPDPTPKPTPDPTPRPTPTPSPIMGGGGFGDLQGVNPVITPMFRHLYTPEQTAQYGLRQPNFIPWAGFDNSGKVTWKLGTQDKWWLPDQPIKWGSFSVGDDSGGGGGGKKKKKKGGGEGGGGGDRGGGGGRI